MRCSKAQHCIQLELDGELPPADAALLRQHLAACPACQRVSGQMQKVRKGMRTLSAATAAPGLPSLCSDPALALGASSGGSVHTPPLIKLRDHRRRWVATLAIAASIALLLAGGWVARSRMQTSKQPVPIAKSPQPAPPELARGSDVLTIPAAKLAGGVRVSVADSSPVLAVPVSSSPEVTILRLYPKIQIAREAHEPQGRRPEQQQGDLG